MPDTFNGESFVDYLLKEQSILTTPGIPFGDRGENYIRFSLAVDEEILSTFVERMKEIKNLWENSASL